MINNLAGTPLSNFYPITIRYDGLDYPSVEHAFQASKTLNLNDRRSIADLLTARQAKTAGRSVGLRPDWEAVKLGMMRDLLRLKFNTDGPARQFLLASLGQLLVEGNSWGDTFWGVVNGAGDNWLGFLLMGVRAEIRSHYWPYA